MTNPLATVILIHGYGGSPDRPRFDWLRNRLTEREIGYVAPAMPMSKPETPSELHPVEAAWLNVIDEHLVTAQPPVILVGHSLGGLAVLRWLETQASEPIFAAISLAGVTLPQHPNHAHRTFSSDWQEPTDWARIRSHARHLAGIYSRDDDTVLPVEGERLERDGGVELVWVDGRGHFTDADGVTDLPEVLQAIDTLIHLAK